MWKKIHVKLKFLRLEFHFFFFLAFFWVPSVLLRADLTQHSSSSSHLIEAPTFFLCSSSLHQIVPLFVSVLHLFLASIRSSSLLKTRSSTQSLKIRSSTNVLLQPNCPSSTRSSSSALHSSQVLFFFKSDKNWLSKTWFCFLELESYRLEI